MSAHDRERPTSAPTGSTRRRLLAAAAATGAGVALGAAAGGAIDDDRPTLAERWGDRFHDHYQRMSREEIQRLLRRLEERYRRTYGVPIEVHDDRPLPGVVFGYAINIAKCKGYRRCVEACVRENNTSRDPQIQYIRVLELPQGTFDLEGADHYYDHEVPAPGRFYLPVQCHHCENAPCIKACPVKATWMEPDGIVVVDYDWCIGCRYCMAACPYWARRFNWREPLLPPEEINTRTHYLGNRPRPKGVVEKCHFCIHRTRRGLNPACMDACPTGARVFGNLLDPESEIRYILEHKTVFRLKEELNTEPKFWYYTD